MGVLDYTIVLWHVNLLFIFGLVASLKSGMIIISGELGVCSYLSGGSFHLTFIFNEHIFMSVWLL